MDYRPYIAWAFLLGLAAVAFMLVILVRARQRSRSGRAGRHSKSAVMSRSLVEMLDYYAPAGTTTGVEPNEGRVTLVAEASSAVTTSEPAVSRLPEAEELSVDVPRAPAGVAVEPAPALVEPVQISGPRPLPSASSASTAAEGDSCDDARPHVFMDSPVEIWFDGVRVGVKGGSDTHQRFLRCANALLGDLKAARSDTR